MSENINVNFSIIIPTYNRAWCIERAIDSVLGQKYQNWEMIIVDDGSTDNTEELVEKYLSDKRIRYFYKNNGGVGSARNLGLKFASGGFVMFLDSDDEFVAGSLEMIFAAISKYEGFSMFSFRVIDQHGKQVSYTELVNGDLVVDFGDFINKKYISGETFFVYRQKVFENNFFDEDVNGGEELLLLKFVKENGLVLINENARIYYLGSNDSLITSKLTREKVANICKIQERLIERYGDDLKRYNRKYLGTAYLVLARMLALSGKRKKSSVCFARGCFYNMLDSKRIVLYLISLVDFDLSLNNALNRIHNG